MRILHLVQRYYPYVGGSELYFQELSEQWAALGNVVTVATTDAWDLDHFWASGRRTIPEVEQRYRNVHIRRFPVVRAPGPPIVYPILRRLMVEFGRIRGTRPLVRRLSSITPRLPGLERYLGTTNEPFDIVTTCNITLDFMIRAGANFARQRNIPHVCIPFVHLGVPGDSTIVRYYSQPFQIDLLKAATRVVVQTSLEGRFLAEHGVVPEQIMQTGCWIRPETLSGGDGDRFRKRYDMTGPIVLSIGTAAYDKGTMHLVEAMSQLWQDGSPARLVLIGSTMLAQWEQYWHALAPTIRERITVIRDAPHQTKLDALAAADLYAMPSRTDSFGIVYLEAWAYHLPVIGARAGGVPDVIEDGVTGLLVPFGEVQTLANAIQRILDRPDYGRQLGQAGNAATLRHWTFDAKFAQFDQLYASLIEEQRSYQQS
ncbi:MAG: glycosyltransferase family 4 protein [Herpetosiphon sp.]